MVIITSPLSNFFRIDHLLFSLILLLSSCAKVLTIAGYALIRKYSDKFIFRISGNQSLIGFHLVFKRVFLSSAVCRYSGISTNPFLCKTEAGRLLITFTRTLHHFLQKTFSETPESFGKWPVHPLPCQGIPLPHFSYCKSA